MSGGDATAVVRPGLLHRVAVPYAPWLLRGPAADRWAWDAPLVFAQTGPELVGVDRAMLTGGETATRIRLPLPGGVGGGAGRAVHDLPATSATPGSMPPTLALVRSRN